MSRPSSAPFRSVASLSLAFVAAALLFLLPAGLEAQAQATTGIIRGRVLDQEARAVPGALVVVRNENTGLTRSLTTRDDGVFIANLLPVGTYNVTASADAFRDDVERDGVELGLGETVNLTLVFRPAVELEELVVTGERTPLVDTERAQTETRFDERAVDEIPSDGRNYLDLTKLTPGVKVVQGPDGEEISIGGQRGIFNNVSVDGADFNNPFFGEQRGGQRPAFTFNKDAVKDMVVVNGGAPAEFGRSAGGFVNVITKSGTNQLEGTAHWFGKYDEFSADFEDGTNPPLSRNQFGFTLGGPIVRDKLFFFVAYDQQEQDETKQRDRLRNVVDQEAFERLQGFFGTAFDGALAGDFGPVTRTNDAIAAMAKFDWNVNERHHATLKYNATYSEQVNGTFDVDTWGESANGIEQDESHAVNGSLSSQLTPTISNEFRFQWARENRPRPYEGPTFPDGRNFPDTGAGFADGFRWGQPFFLPVEAKDSRVQLLNNVTISQGDHLIKVGAEFNRVEEDQTFIGFGNGRFIFDSVDGFINFVEQGPTFVTCSDGSSSNTGSCPAGTTITGPLLLYLQFAPVPPLTTIEEAGSQEIPQWKYAFFAQDTWKPGPNVTLDYGVRWEGVDQPDVITSPDEVFFSPFIGQTKNGLRFPSDGGIPNDFNNVQPRLAVTWDVRGDGTQAIRANTGIYYSRVPSLVFASTRSTNGSRGQNLFRNSALIPVLGAPPAYDELLSTEGVFPFRPDVFVTDDDFESPRTFAGGFSYERTLTDWMAGSITYNVRYTDKLFRFRNLNADVFGSPWATGLPAVPGEPASAADTLNGIGQLTVLESTAKSLYQGITLGFNGRLGDRIQFQADYTVSWDKSDDDNERDPFNIKHAKADMLDPEFNFSDRDQRHQGNFWILATLPAGFTLNNRISGNTAQPISEVCGPGGVGTGARASAPTDRICPDGSVLERNTLRKDNGSFTWDTRVSKRFDLPTGQAIEFIAEGFNLTNADNFRDPGEQALLFNFDGTIRSGLGDPRRFQAGTRWIF